MLIFSFMLKFLLKLRQFIKLRGGYHRWYRVYTKEVINFVHHFCKKYVPDIAAVGINGLKKYKLFNTADFCYNANNLAKAVVLVIR